MLRFCWTLVLVGGLAGINAAAWVSYTQAPKGKGQPVLPPGPKENGPPRDGTPKEEVAKSKDDTPPRDDTKKDDSAPKDDTKPKDDSSPKNDSKPKDDTKPKDDVRPRSKPPKEYTERLAAGRQALKDRRWEDAVHNFEKAAEAWSLGKDDTDKGIAQANSGADSEKRANGKVKEARGQIKDRKYRGAGRTLEEALAIDPDHPEARQVSATVASRLNEFDSFLKTGKDARGRKNFKLAAEKFEAALALVSDDPDAARLLAEARKAATPPAKLKGSVMVMVLLTKTSSLRTGNKEFVKQLANTKKDLAAQLLGGELFVLTKEGPVPWQAGKEWKEADALSNAPINKLLDSLAAGVKTLDARAETKDVPVVVVLETDHMPDTAPKMGPRYRLCYRFTNRDQDAVVFESAFGSANRFKMPDEVGEFIADAVPKTDGGGKP